MAENLAPYACMYLAQEESPQDDYETSEMLMYKAMVLEEGGKLEEALAHLADGKACLHCHTHDMHITDTQSPTCRVIISVSCSTAQVAVQVCDSLLDTWGQLLPECPWTQLFVQASALAEH